MPDANDYLEIQRLCPHCKRGTNFIVKEIVSKKRAERPDADMNNVAVMVVLICLLCEKLAYYHRDPLSSVFTFQPIEEKKRKTTKRIA